MLEYAGNYTTGSQVWTLANRKTDYPGNALRCWVSKDSNPGCRTVCKEFKILREETIIDTIIKIIFICVKIMQLNAFCTFYIAFSKHFLKLPKFCLFLTPD